MAHIHITFLQAAFCTMPVWFMAFAWAFEAYFERRERRAQEAQKKSFSKF